MSIWTLFCLHQAFLLARILICLLAGGIEALTNDKHIGPPWTGSTTDGWPTWNGAERLDGRAWKVKVLGMWLWRTTKKWNSAIYAGKARHPVNPPKNWPVYNKNVLWKFEKYSVGTQVHFSPLFQCTTLLVPLVCVNDEHNLPYPLTRGSYWIN